MVEKDGSLAHVEPPQISTPPPAISNLGVGVPSLESQLHAFMFEMWENKKVLLRKFQAVAEENKFWIDLVLDLYTPSSTRSGPFPTTPTYGFVNLQESCAIASKKLAKVYGLQDILAKSATQNEGISKAPGEDGVPKHPDVENKGDNEDVMDGTAQYLLHFEIKGETILENNFILGWDCYLNLFVLVYVADVRFIF